MTEAASNRGSGYVRIGSVRVRVSRPDEVGANEEECCCGMASRIPLPQDKNRRGGIFSPVYRTTLQWTGGSGCFGRNQDDGHRLITDSDTLDRLNRFRLDGARGGGKSGDGGAAHKKKPPRSSDKTDRLRELTERLKAPSGLRKEGALPAAKEQVRDQVTGEDVLSGVNLCLAKPESRTIVGSYIQRTIPYRSASFSQGDFSPLDGKYTRSGGRPLANIRGSTLPRKKLSEGSSTNVSPGSSTVLAGEEPASSKTSIDSAVGSDEWIARTPDLSGRQDEAEQANKSGGRSLTHPLARRGSREDNLFYSSIDGNGLKSLAAAKQGLLLEGVREESDTDSASARSDLGIEDQSCQECGSQGHPLDRAEALTLVQINQTVESDCNGEKKMDTVHEEKVKRSCENGRSSKNELMIDGSEDINLNPYSSPKIFTDSLSSEGAPLLSSAPIGVESSVNRSKLSDNSVETYVTKWPDEGENVDRDKRTVELQDSQTDEVKLLQSDYSRLKEVEIPSELVSGQREPLLTAQERELARNPIAEWNNGEELNKRRSVGTGSDRKSNEWPSSAQEEPQSPEDVAESIHWPNPPAERRWLERPRLVCQSSEERDEDARSSPRRYQLNRADSLSEGESDPGDRRPNRDCASPSLFADLSDSECRTIRSSHTPRRYSKRPLRGPYGQMLEAEMKKPETSRKLTKLQYNDDLKFLEDFAQTAPASTTGNRLSLGSSRPRAMDDCQLKRSYTSPDPPVPGRTSPKRKVNSVVPFLERDSMPVVYHQRTTSSPSQLESQPRSPELQPSPQLLAQLLRGSSERANSFSASSVHHSKDTRTHVVVELYDTERSYVESLQILVMKYLQPLKSPENAGLVDTSLVDEIFYQVPAILAHHEVFLEELRKRLDNWDVKQRVGDVFLEAFTKPTVIETYIAFINNWKTAKEAIKTTSQNKPAFARFLEAMAREHKGKLALDSLLIMPVQRIPRYELLIQTLLKHTEPCHPDHTPLLEAQREVHQLAVRINCTERESLELGQLEGLIEGLMHLVAPDRSFLRHDMVTMATGQGRKERGLFLFSDLLVITSIKRRSTTIRKPNPNCPGSVINTLDANKYKLLMKIPLDDLEIVKAKDENVRRMLREMEHLSEDVSTLSQMCELAATLHCPHAQLEETTREMLTALNKQLAERQNTDSQLSYLELMLNTQNGLENIAVIFSKPEKRTSWEEAFNEAKQRLAVSAERWPCPELVAPVPIRKTRAGLQFTCAAPTVGLRDVWVCNSDGYVGQVCVLSLHPEPTVESCNGVCNARILCIAPVPTNTLCANEDRGGQPACTNSNTGISISVEDADKGPANIQLDSSSSSEGEDEREGCNEGGEGERQQPTMWLGTEDGCIHVYNCTDNIRIKKNKIKIQHGSAVHCIIYLDNRVFVSLANGDISVYMRDQGGGWKTSEPVTVTVGSAAMPVTRMLPISGKLWCSCHNTIRVVSTTTLQIEHSFVASAESGRSVTCLVASGLGVWVSLQNSATVRLFHAISFERLAEINVVSAVNKMLAGCDEIIRQHKAACLRVTSLLASKELLWVGTSAGVILTMPLPHVTTTMNKIGSLLSITGVPHGHTGHVRFLTAVEQNSLQFSEHLHRRHTGKVDNGKLLIISGGDGYEDFRSASVSEVAGREDSTNHLLLWHV